ncbi:hypothetical protein [Enterovibrio norvegicus]|uniref:hypothetical protein n=1 Tax=Enterovibrio norvegicus TaxID=188144 RepID=UPI00352BF237
MNKIKLENLELTHEEGRSFIQLPHNLGIVELSLSGDGASLYIDHREHLDDDSLGALLIDGRIEDKPHDLVPFMVDNLIGHARFPSVHLTGVSKHQRVGEPLTEICVPIDIEDKETGLQSRSMIRITRKAIGSCWQVTCLNISNVEDLNHNWNDLWSDRVASGAIKE